MQRVQRVQPGGPEGPGVQEGSRGPEGPEKGSRGYRAGPSHSGCLLLGFPAVIEISPAHLPVACTRRLHTQNNKKQQIGPVGCTVDCLAWTRETSTRESFSMERGPELSAVLWTVLILCIVLILYLSFVPEDRQQKDKDAADAFTATVIPSFKKKPDDKKTT